MLARTARHGIPPTITLDFLVPSLLSHRKTYHEAYAVRSTPTQHIATKSTHASPATQLPPRPPSWSSKTPPGAILAQLEHQHRALEPHVLAAFANTNTQVEAFSRVVPELRHAFQERDMAKASELWSMLNEGNLLVLFGPLQHDICSRLVSSHCYHSYRDGSFTPEVQILLEEMALVMAVEGATFGLRQLMLLLVRWGRPREVLALYDKYLEGLRNKGLLQDTEPSTENTDETIPSPIRDEILLSAIVAYVQLDAFAEALPVYLSAATRIAYTTVEEFLTLIPADLRARVEDFARRLDTASLITRPDAMLKHLSNLSRDAAYLSIAKLYSTMIAGVRGPRPWLAVDPSGLAGTRTLVLPHFFWTSFLKSFLLCRRVDLSERLWDDMLNLGIVPKVDTWNALLDGYARNRAVDSVVSTWDLMLSQGVRPDALSYRALLHGLYHAGRFEEGHKRLEEFERDVVKPGESHHDSSVLSVYNTVIYDLLFASRFESAQALFEKLETKGPKPDIVTYNTFLRFHARKADLKGMAHVLQKLQPSGTQPDVYTFSTLLSAMLKVRPDADKMMVTFMKRHGVAPDTTALTAVIDQQLRGRTPEGFKIAMELLSKMEGNEYETAEPNAVTYTVILTAINEATWLDRSAAEEESRRMWDRMRERGITPERATYNILIKTSLASPGKDGVDNAIAYYRHMWKERVHLGNDTWYLLLHGLMAKEEWELADEIVKDMGKMKRTAVPRWLRVLANTVNKMSRRNRDSRMHL